MTSTASAVVHFGLILVLLPLISKAWVIKHENRPSCTRLCMNQGDHRRRSFVHSILTGAALLLPSSSNAEVVRAVGSGEIECRAKGNCLETGEWDGAIGWGWGGKDRCDPSDPKCGPDGRLRESIVGKPVPQDVSEITHVVGMRIEVGRGEVGVLKLGLYGADCPGSVGELVDFFTSGLQTIDINQASLGSVSSPASLNVGGVVDSITPGLTVDFGVPSQANAYGRSRGLSKTDGFVPQPKPKASIVAEDKVVRSHDAAGLVSVGSKGLGYGGTGFESDDEAFESSFLITASAVPALDKNRRVAGQVLDAESMAFLERLASLPTKKGIKGVIPGQTTGPPLLKVAVREIVVSKVTGGPSTS